MKLSAVGSAELRRYASLRCPVALHCLSTMICYHWSTAAERKRWAIPPNGRTSCVRLRSPATLTSFGAPDILVCQLPDLATNGAAAIQLGSANFIKGIRSECRREIPDKPRDHGSRFLKKFDRRGIASHRRCLALQGRGYPISGEIFVPFGASTADTVCPNGCIAIFADNAGAVPEASTWAMMILVLQASAWRIVGILSQH